MKYGDRLKKLRKEKKLSQQELADKLGINRSTYARYETSTTEPDYETLRKLADFFGVTVDYILGRTNIPNDQSSNTNNLKTWLRQSNTDLSEEELEELEEDIRGYLEFRMKRILGDKK